MGRPPNLNWCPDGSAAKIQAPTNALATQGYVARQPITAKNLNYYLWYMDQFLQYLDGIAAINSAAASIISNARIVPGNPSTGLFYSLAFSGSTGTFTWSAPFCIAIPGIPDGYNQVNAGSVALTDGQVAYVNANIPFVTMGNTVSGNQTVSGLVETAGISVGQTVIGAGIPSNTTVTSIGSTSVNLSAAPTATANGVQLTFAGQGNLTMQVASSSGFTPQANSIVLARCAGPYVYFGINTAEIILRNGESKQLLFGGYLRVATATAGVALTQGQAVYLSAGGSVDTGRTAGAVYPLDTSNANGAARGLFYGIVMGSQASVGGTVYVVTSGTFSGFTGLSIGVPVYGDPATPGGVTQTRPTTTNQWLAPIGMAETASRISINAANFATSQQIQSINPWPQYSVASEAQLNAVVNTINNSGPLGSVIVVTGPFTMQGQITLPAYSVLTGRHDSAIITLANGGTLFMGDGCKVQHCWFQNTDGNSGNPLVATYGQMADIYDCEFLMATGATNTALVFYGLQCTSRRNKFWNVVNNTAYGIAFSGNENSDADSVYSAS